MKFRNSVTCNRLLPNTSGIIAGKSEDLRSGSRRQGCGLGVVSAWFLTVQTTRGCPRCRMSSVRGSTTPPPAALTPTIHNLCADQTSEKRKHRVVFMPLVATSPACVFFSGALSKSSQSPRPYKSAPRAALCENTGDWACAPRSAVNFPANKVNIDSDISTCPRVTTITF